MNTSLYKLLIYEEGDFFLPHRDSEKEPGMFANLVAGLVQENLQEVIKYEPPDLSVVASAFVNRPYTLRLTKTQAAYERKLKEWEEDVALLGQLKAAP